MSDTDETTQRLEARMAYLGIRDQTLTADLLPTRSMPSGLLDPDCRDATAFLVRIVRATYARCRKKEREAATARPDRYGDHSLARWDGGYDWQGRYRAPIWARIAGAALERGFDVEDYVESQFARAAEHGSPYPNKLLSPAALDEYERDRMGEVVRRGEISRFVMDNHFIQQATQEMTIFGKPGLGAGALAALRNPTNDLKPFYRYWVVAQLDPENPDYCKILLTYRRPALRQYACSVRAYEAAYDHDVLGDFRLVIVQTKLVFADLVGGDQGRWVLPAAGPATVAHHQGPGEPGP